MSTSIKVSLNQLLFDPENPRLPEEISKEQRAIFRYIVDDIQVKDLLDALSTTGFIQADPIIVRKGADANTYYVVEGNRRLAALKLLDGEKIGDGGAEPAVPAVTEAVKSSFAQIPVQKDWSHDELDAYLGYKHVTSTKEWSPEAKARFVLARLGQNLSDDNLKKYAQQFGTNLGQLKRWVTASLVLKQAQDENIFDPENVWSKRYFGTFYTLLYSTEVQKFVGLDTEVIASHPIPSDKMSNLQEFIRWTIGTRDIAPIINSRSARKLDDVLRSPRALQSFRNEPDIERALKYTEYTAGEIANIFRTAAFNIESCLVRLIDVKDNADVKDAYELIRQAVRKAKANMEVSLPDDI